MVNTTGLARTSSGRRADALRPLVIDVALPLGVYYLLSHLGLSTVDALLGGSVVPAARTVFGVVRDRRLNVLAALILAVNLAGIALTFLTGDPRLMLAKEGVVSSAIGLAMLGSLVVGRPLMTIKIKPMLARAREGYAAAFERLSATSPRFRTLERTLTAVWGVLLLADSVLRVIGAFTLPVSTMVWLGPVLLIGTIAIGVYGSGKLIGVPMKRMLDAEVAR